MDDHTTIKLKIPRQDHTGLPLFQPDADSASTWVQSLPVTHTNSLVNLLGQALSDLNRTALSPEIRYNILEVLRPSVDVALLNLSKRYLNQPLVMPVEPQRMADLSDRLFTLATTAYTIVAIETIQQRDAIREANPARLTCQSIQRALIFGGRKVLQSFQLHRPLQIQGWQTLHQLYALAEKQRLGDLPVPEPLSGGKTIRATYLQALLLACCKPNQLRQVDLAALFRGLGQWSERASLDNRGSGNDLFLVDLNSDQPPLYSALYHEQPGALCRYINTAPLVIHLKALKAATDKTDNVDKNTALHPSMLDHLIAALSNMSLRNFKRKASNKSLYICVGLSSTHYHVAGERPFEQLLYGRADALAITNIVGGNRFLPTHSKGDEWQKANPGTDYTNAANFEQSNDIELSPVTKALLVWEEESELPLAERYPVVKVPLADASPGGYCLDWAGELPVDIKVGDIVGLKEEEDREWVIAVIRWLGRPEESRTLIGLELLSPRAVAYGARIHQKTGDKAAPIRVLLLPEIKLVGQPHTLITPRTVFKEQQKVTVGNFSKAASIQLTRHIASTGSFSQFEFRYIKELGDVLATNQQGQLGTEFDSLWSSI